MHTFCFRDCLVGVVFTDTGLEAGIGLLFCLSITISVGDQNEYINARLNGMSLS